MIRRALLISGLLIGLLVGGAWIGNAVYLAPLSDADARLAALTQQLTALRQRQAEAEHQLVTTSATSFDLTDLAVRDGDPTSYAARFQEMTRDAVVRSGGQATSSQAVTADLGGGYTKVSLLLRAQFDESGLLAFLRATESTTPLVLVDALEVHTLPARADSHPLDVTASLSAFHLRQ